jgi:hypothetical protein
MEPVTPPAAPQNVREGSPTGPGGAVGFIRVF